jgi:hypothetical protein
MADYDNTNKGVAFRNDYRKEDKHPNFKGKGNFNGQDFDIAIWERTSPKGQFFSISFSEPYEKEMREQEQSGYDKAKQARDSLQDTTDYSEKISLDDIPFN